MAKEKIDVLVEGGKATAAPPLGPALGPLGVNIGEVVGTINEKTKAFAGMKVPVKVTVDSDTKEFDIEVHVQRGKKLTNMRSSGADKAVKITPAIKFTLEEMLEFIRDDELVEVTPKSLRMRKVYLDPTERKRFNLKKV